MRSTLSFQSTNISLMRARALSLETAVGEQMRVISNNADQKKAEEIIYKLLNDPDRDVFAFYTDSRSEYDILFNAAREGLLPDLLSITHRGLRLNKRFVHAPMRQTANA